MDKLRRRLNLKCKIEKTDTEKPISCQIKVDSNSNFFDFETIKNRSKKKKVIPDKKTEKFPLFKKSCSHEINENLNDFQKVYSYKRNLKTTIEDNDKHIKPIIHINLSELREEIENEKNANFPEIYIYFKADSSKNIKNFNRAQSKNLDSKIIFPEESSSKEMKKEYKKANSANIKNRHGKNVSSKTYLKNSREFMRYIQAMKLDNNK